MHSVNLWNALFLTLEIAEISRQISIIIIIIIINIIIIIIKSLRQILKQRISRKIVCVCSNKEIHKYTLFLPSVQWKNFRECPAVGSGCATDKAGIIQFNIKEVAL